MKTAAFVMLIVALGGTSLLAQEKVPSLFLGQYERIAWLDTNETNPSLKQDVTKLKSENHAFNLSLWSTLLPLSTGMVIALNTEDNFGPPLFLMGVGYLIGPATGYFYGERPGRAFLGMGIRLLLTPAPFAAAWGICGWDCGPDDAASNWAMLAMGGGAALIAGVDILMVKGAVRKYNQSLQKTGWILVPKYFAKHKASGLELQLRF